MRAHWAAPLLLAACFTTKASPQGEQPEDVDAQRGACSAFEGVTFESLAKQECGITPDGTAECHWRVSLDMLDKTQSTYEWRYSDVIESGTVQCTGRQIQFLSGPRGAGPAGAYDDSTGELIWNGVVYVRGS